MTEADLGVEAHYFEDGGTVPNNPALPLLVYRQVSGLGLGDMATAIEARFARNGWGNGWRNGIYPFHHFHSNAHEVLGLASGRAKVRFGGASGVSLELMAGDVVVVPAGVGHKSEEASTDLLVIGAYPPGAEPDMVSEGEEVGRTVREQIGAVPVPATDPVLGADGPLVKIWREAKAG
ncbi:cupin [Inquilinus limosus]|uniref:cupin domain-containing protein n=1 Tax=Inquilinus limosus TaxID=171674 RepID=UPI003F1922E6